MLRASPRTRETGGLVRDEIPDTEAPDTGVDAKTGAV
jgi:hypothetical protein